MPGATDVNHVLGSPVVPPAGDSAGDPPHIHRAIDNSLPPAATIESGDTVAFECPGLPLPRDATAADLSRFDPERPHAVVGPVAVAGARPGDTLAVEVLDVELTQGFGHTGIVPGAGLLGDEVAEPYVHNFSWAEGAERTRLCDGVSIPLNPFCGILGVMPERPGAHSTIPPRQTGGNIDVRHLVPGSTLFLPVEVRGALFFAGDGHGAQGDGEVCVSGLETGVRATLRLSLAGPRAIRQPQFIARPPLSVDSAGPGYYGTTGIGPALYACSRDAVRAMVEYLVAERGLDWREAYVLCSLAADLKISEVVDAPNWVVSAYLPLSVFDEERTGCRGQPAK